MRKGIAVAGTLLVDNLNTIASFPNCGQVEKIKSQFKSTGGIVPNVGIDLKKLNKNLDVYAIGKVGNDSDGILLEKVLSDNGLDTKGIVKCDVATSFSDVMSIEGGQRTFFIYTGACSIFGYDDIDFENLNVKMFHLGYYLLLDKIDAGDGEKILKKLKEMGIKTSIDLVTEHSNRYSVVIPSLKYVDNLIINEEEAGSVCGIEPTDENIPKIAKMLKNYGVVERVIIHMPRKAVCLSKDGYTEVESYKLPNGFVKGTTGAGDAFCAGALLSIYNGLSDRDILENANICAVGSLSKADASSGMRSLEELKEIVKGFKKC